MTKREKNELAALREDIRQLRDEMRVSRPPVYHPVYVPYVPYTPYVPYQPQPWWGTITITSTATSGIVTNGYPSIVGNTIPAEMVRNAQCGGGVTYTSISVE